AFNAALYPAYALPGVFANNVYPAAVNGSLWSLPVEFLMYLTFPVVYAISRMDKTNRLLCAFTIGLCALSLYAIRISPMTQQTVVYGTGVPSILDTGPYFFLGALFSMTQLRKALDPTVALFVAGALLFFQPNSAFWMEITLYVVAPYCLLSYATAASPVLSRAGRFGDPSYGIYLYGFPAQQTVCHFMPGVSAVTNTLIALPIAVILAYASWHLIEKRALAIKPRRHRAVPATISLVPSQ
ncbi:MAG: acyltransferase family protein, partial [Luteimonas sp.]